MRDPGTCTQCIPLLSEVVAKGGRLDAVLAEGIT